MIGHAYSALNFLPKQKPGISLFSTTKVIPKEITGIILWGGEDICPSFYKQKANSYSGATDTPSKRDIFEFNLVDFALKNNLPIIGICRGAQLLCIKAGGSLIQHVDNHNKSHSLITNEGKTFFSNSIHHQMMNLKNTNHVLLAKTYNQVAKVGYGEEDEEVSITEEPEVVFFPKLNALAIQPHPEMMTEESVFVKWVEEQCDKLFPNVFKEI